MLRSRSRSYFKVELGDCSGCQLLHSTAVMGAASGAPSRKRIKPAEVEQKLRLSVSVETGVATATNSVQIFCRHSAVTRKRYPFFTHQELAVQLGFPRVGSSKPA